MLENCTDLYECEKILSASLDNIKYLGEVDFSLEDIDKLSALIKEKFDEEKDLGFLKGVPACLSFYLVGKGIINYYSGEFWPPVLEELGIAGDRSQNVLGEIFLNFLQNRGFSHVHIKRALPYVAPILLHGGIPFSCLKEFYEKIIKYLLDRRIVNESSIRSEICRMREIEEHKEALLDKKEDLFEQINTLEQEIEHLENIIELFRKRKELQEKTADQEAWANLPDDYDRFIATSELRQREISQKIEELLNKKAEYQEKIKSIAPDDQRFLDFKGEIEKLVQEFDSYRSGREKISVLKDGKKRREDELTSLAAHLWQWEEGEQFGEESRGTQKITGLLRGFLASELARLSTALESTLSLDIDKFAALVREQPSLDSLVASGEAWVGRFEALQTVCREHRRDEQELAQLEQEMAEWETVLEQVAATLLPDPITGPPEKIIRELNERLLKAKVRKKEADAARETLEKEILPAINDAEKRRARVEQEIAALEQRLGELGAGLKDIDQEIKRLKERETECLKQLKSFTEIDQRLVELAEVIKKMEQDLPFYQEQQKRQQIMKAKIGKQMEEIEYLTSKLWPEGGERICSSSARVELQDFIKYASFEKIDHLLNMWVEDLKRLQAAHYKYRQDIDKLLSLEKEAKDWEEDFNRVTTALSIQPGGILEEAVVGLAYRLKQAEERKKEAEAARAALKKEVCPALHEARSSVIQIEQEVAVIKQKIRELGKGDLEAGVRILEEKKQALKELKEVEKELEQRVAALPYPVGNRQEALLLKEGKNKELDIKRVDLSQVEEQLANCVSPLNECAEPVRRFVIYGGEWTIKWLCACTALHRRYHGEVIPLPEGLPARVVTELEKLIREEIEFRKNVPKIILDPGRGDLKMVIGGHRFHIYDVTSPPEIYVSIVSGEVPPVWIKEIRLRAYLKNGIVEIPEDLIDLPHIASEYRVTLNIGGYAYPSWWVKTWDGMPYMIFSEKGEKIEPGRLTRQRAWLFFPERYELFPENAVVAGSDIYFEGNRYRLALVNFVLEPVIYLVDKEGNIFEIIPSGSPGPGPFLNCEEFAVGAWAEGKRPIYTGTVPRLCVPSNEEEIKEWTIRIIKTFADGTRERLIDEKEISDLGNFRERGYFEVDLSAEELLGPHPLGEYSIILSRRDISEYSFELVFFPDLMLFFEPELYFPREAEGGEAKLTMVIPENLIDVLQVRMKEPAKIVEVDDDEVHIAVGLENDVLQAELFYPFKGRQCRTLVTVEIPKLRWRIRGAKTAGREEWSQHIKEVWHGACYGPGNPKLEVTLPLNNFASRSKVYLEEETGPQINAKARGRFLQFDLSGLADTLRMSKRETCSLRLALEDSRGRIKADGKLFDIRCRWRIENFRYTVEESAGERCLKAAWLDRGEQQDRVVRLWRLWEPWVEPLFLAVPDGVSEVEIRRNAAEFLPGPYLIKFDLDDSWGEGLVDEFPTERSNSEQIFIKSAGIHISVSECYWVNKRKLRISGKLANTAGRKEVSVRLYGVVKGRYKVWSALTSTNENGHFNFQVEDPFAQIYYPAKEIARPHWLGVIAEDNVYHFQILPEPGGLWWPLALALEGAFSDLDEDGGGQIYIGCREERLDEPLLNKEISKNVLRDFRQGKEKSPVDIQIGGKIKKAYLWRDKIELKTKAVKCTSGNCPFGKSVEPDQHAWDNKHFPAGCKSFIVNFREIRASLSWYLDLTMRIRDGQEKYRLAGNHLLTLYNKLTRPLPEPVRLDEQNPEFDLEKLIAALWEREKILLAAWESKQK